MVTKEEQNKKIDGIYKNALKNMNEKGQKVLSLVKSLIKKRELKQIEELSKKLKE